MTTCDLAPLINKVWPYKATEKLTGKINISIHTAHEWAQKRVSKVRRAQVAAILLSEMDRQDRERAQWREQLTQILKDEARAVFDDYLGVLSRRNWGDKSAVCNQ